MAKKQLNVEEKVAAEEAAAIEIAEEVAAEFVAEDFVEEAAPEEFVEQKQSLKEQYPDGVPLHILNSLA
jgi:hypothetical protein